MSEEVQAVLAFVFAVWGSVSATLKFGEVANQIRDEVILGKKLGETITLEHRFLKLKNDWIPIKCGGALLCLAYSLSLACAPSIVAAPKSLEYALYAAAIFPGIGFGFFLLGLHDYWYMRRVLESY